MIGIDTISSAGVAGEAERTTDPSSLGRDEFLQMLIAQLENQDPLNPQDATEFTAQLATFSSLEQLLAIGESLDGLVASQEAAQGFSSASLIGRDVTADGSQIEVAEGGLPLLDARFVLEGNSENTRVGIYNAAGARVRELELGAVGQGEHGIEWDGLDTNEQPVPAGFYTFRVTALSGGEPVGVRTLVQGRVTGSVPGAADPLLMLGGLAVPLSQVQEVRDGGLAP